MNKAAADCGLDGRTRIACPTSGACAGDRAYHSHIAAILVSKGYISLRGFLHVAELGYTGRRLGDRWQKGRSSSTLLGASVIAAPPGGWLA